MHVVNEYCDLVVPMVTSANLKYNYIDSVKGIPSHQQGLCRGLHGSRNTVMGMNSRKHHLLCEKMISQLVYRPVLQYTTLQDTMSFPTAFEFMFELCGKLALAEKGGGYVLEATYMCEGNSKLINED